jgi:hypothetical protein
MDNSFDSICTKGMKMKKLLRWQLLGLGLCCAAAPSMVAAQDDPPKANKKQVVVVANATDDSDVLEKVRSELDKAGLSEASKAEILKKLENLIPKKDGTGDKAGAKKFFKAEVQQSKSDDEKGEDVRVIIKGGDEEKEHALHLKGLSIPGMKEGIKTQIIRSFGNGEDSFRIGVACQQLGDESETDGKEGDAKASQPGLRIESVLEDSPASKAGIQKGDVLLTVNAKEIKSVSDLTAAIQESGKQDKPIELELTRNDKKMTMQVKPTKMKASDIEMDNINLNLNLPSGGFVLDEDSMKKWQEFATKFQGSGPQTKSFAFAMPDQSGLKKEVEQLKTEIAELKKMLRELIDKK